MKVLGNYSFYELPACIETLFDKNVTLLPSVTELFELELAFLEYKSLPKDQIIERSAYIQSIDGKFTTHYLMYNQTCEGLIENRSNVTKNYFENGTFSTGYATHGLFPYRGKFHPQLIKALLNIIGVEKGQTILEPMCGSGTANIEAALMGINSYAVDISPFCQFMTQAKYDALQITNSSLSLLIENRDKLFNFFSQGNILKKLKNVTDNEKLAIYNLALLAYLDSMGYSKRVIKSDHRQLFEKVLTRYENTVRNFINNPYFKKVQLGKLNVLPDSDALDLKIVDNSIDGVITSPPYSFAIDYAKNDEAQLEYLGYNIEKIKGKMIGLIGKNKDERLNNYFRDMKKVCSEIYRVLKNDKYFVMIIGSNTNQTGGIRLEKTIIQNCEEIGLKLVKSILKPIKGMRNTMKDEYLLFFQKNPDRN